MQIKKEVFLFCLLIVLSIGLLIAADLSANTPACSEKQAKCLNCCQEKVKIRTEYLWNFITGGILHLSV